MTESSHALEEFQTLVQPLLGLPVTLPWKGYASAIFLELGRLSPLETERQRYNKGEACISIEWDWRVERGSLVLYGSGSSRPEMQRGIRSLLNARIQSLDLDGEVPELAVRFSNGHCLRSTIMFNGDPQWTIRLPGSKYLHARDCSLAVADGDSIPDIDGAAAEAQAHAEWTTARWGIPQAEPMPGHCVNCAAFVRINGDFDFLDYGVCSESASPLDGRVVNRESGCPAFRKPCAE